jgi:hypothetical protein
MGKQEKVFSILIQRRAEREGRSIYCVRCEKRLQLGDKIIVNSNNHKTKLYHLNCFLETYI